MNLLEGFEQHLKAKGYGKGTIHTYSYDVNQLIKWTESEAMQIENVRYQDMMAFIKVLNAEYSKRSVSIKLVAIGHFYNYLRSMQLVLENPTSGIKIQGLKRKILYDILPREELNKIYLDYAVNEKDPISQRNKIIIGLMVYQGLHTGNLQRMTVDDIKLRSAQIQVEGSRKSNSRVLALESHQVIELMEYLHQSREVILQNSAKSTNRLFVINHLANIRKNLLVQLKSLHPKVSSFNQIRVSVITHWLKIHNLRQVQYMAGHRYISSTEAYKHNDMEGLIEGIEKYHPM